MPNGSGTRSCAEYIMTALTTYWRVFVTFARNSLVRDMTFRGNFIIDTISSLCWASLNVIFYQRIFHYTPLLGDSGWGRYQFYAFFATGLIINSLAQVLFMTNIDEFTDIIRTGDLDFLLLKPIDTQFLISLRRLDWSSLANLLVGVGFLGFAAGAFRAAPSVAQAVLYVCLPGLRAGDLLQPDDLPGGIDGLDGPQPHALRFLVLHHDLFALSDGDLQRPVGLSTTVLFHVHHSRVDRDQRAGADHRLAAAITDSGRWPCLQFWPPSPAWPPRGGCSQRPWPATAAPAVK